MHGIEREQAAFETQSLDQRLCRRNLVALVVGGKMTKDDRLILGKGAQHMSSLAVVEAIKTAPQGFAVNRDGGRHPVVRVRRHECRGVGPKRLLDCQRIEPVKNGAHRAVGRRFLPAKAECLVQSRKMTVDEAVDLAVGGCPGQHRKNAHQQNGSQTVHLALRSAWIGDGGENIQ